MSGFIDGLRQKASDAYDAMADKVEDVGEAISDAASDVSEEVGETIDAASQKLDEIAEAADAQFERFQAEAMGAAERVLQLPEDVAEVAEGIGREAKEFVSDAGAAIDEAGQRLSEAASRAKDYVSEKVSSGLESAAQTAEEIGTGLRELSDDVANGVRDLGNRAIETGREAVRAAEEGIEEIGRRANELKDDAVELGREALDTAKRAGEAIWKKGEELVGAVEEQLDPKTHIDKLDSEGDSVKVKLGGFGQAVIDGVPVRAQAGGEMEIKKTADGYEMEVTGQAGLGLYAELGKGGDANAVLQGTGKVTLKFTGPNAAEDAARAARTVARMAASTAAGSAVGGGIGQVAADALIGPSAEDMEHLSRHVRSVELRGGVAAEIAGALEGPNGAASGKISGSADIGVRLTFPERDASGNVTKGATVTVFEEAAIQAEGELANGAALRGGIEGKVTLERDINLPASVTGDRLLSDPLGAIRDVRDQTTISEGPRLKIEGQVRAGAGVTVPGVKAHAGGQVGGRFELTMTGNSEDLRTAAGQVLRGDIRGALQTADRRATVEGEVGWFTNTDLQFAPEIKGKAGGIGIEASYRHHDRHHRAQLQSQRPSQALAELERFLAQVDPQALGTGAPPVGAR